MCVLELFLLPFLGQNGRFYISEKSSSFNRKFENSKFWNIPTLIFMTNSKLTSLMLIFVLVGGIECANPGEWHIHPWTIPFNVPIERITPGNLQVVIQFSIVILQIALEIETYLRHLNSRRVINGIVLYFTAF